MSYQIVNPTFPKEIPLTFTGNQKRLFLKLFWVIIPLILSIIIIADAPSLSKIAAIIIAVFALIPCYLWCTDYAKGLPIFPLLSLNYLFTHSFPLVSHNISVQNYSSTQHLISALIVASFLIVGTFIWLFYVREIPIIRPKIKELKSTQVFPFFIAIVIICILYHIGSLSGYLWVLLPNSAVSVIRSLTGALGSLAMIILGYLLGANLLSVSQKRLFIALIAILVFVSGVSLYLNAPGYYVLFAAVGWMLGSGKLPWRLLLISFLIMLFLNFGKGATRATYWNLLNGQKIQPLEYVQVYQNWINKSLTRIQEPKSEITINSRQEGSLIERSSVIQMLLKVQTETGTQRPYLNGRTYSIIPQLLIPRFFNPNKIRGGEANHILSIHYGLQRYGQTLVTSIGWGLLQEAYANFGWIGCIMLGISLGGLYGWVTRWSMNVSAYSFRFLVALLFLVLAFKTEITMGIFAAVIFQSLVLLFMIRTFFMKYTSLRSTV